MATEPSLFEQLRSELLNPTQAPVFNAKQRIWLEKAQSKYRVRVNRVYLQMPTRSVNVIMLLTSSDRHPLRVNCRYTMIDQAIECTCALCHLPTLSVNAHIHSQANPVIVYMQKTSRSLDGSMHIDNFRPGLQMYIYIGRSICRL